MKFRKLPPFMQRGTYPKKKETLISHGLFTDTGTAVLEPPSDVQLHMLETLPNAAYFPTRIPSRWHDSLPFSASLLGMLKKDGYNATDRFYQEMVEDPLGEHIAREFQGKPILLRGSACSIENHIVHGAIQIKNVKEVIRDGCEYDDKESIALTSFDAYHQRIASLTTLWLKKSPRNLRNLVGKHSHATQIYPVLLVYDGTKLQKGSGYTFNFHPTRASRSQAILKAYITDYPL
jgi:hypothetical protein